MISLSETPQRIFRINRACRRRLPTSKAKMCSTSGLILEKQSLQTRLKQLSQPQRWQNRLFSGKAPFPYGHFQLAMRFSSAGRPLHCTSTGSVSPLLWHNVPYKIGLMELARMNIQKLKGAYQLPSCTFGEIPANGNTIHLESQGMFNQPLGCSENLRVPSFQHVSIRRPGLQDTEQNGLLNYFCGFTTLITRGPLFQYPNHHQSRINHQKSSLKKRRS